MIIDPRAYLLPRGNDRHGWYSIEIDWERVMPQNQILGMKSRLEIEIKVEASFYASKGYLVPTVLDTKRKQSVKGVLQDQKKSGSISKC